MPEIQNLLLHVALLPRLPHATFTGVSYVQALFIAAGRSNLAKVPGDESAVRVVLARFNDKACLVQFWGRAVTLEYP